MSERMRVNRTTSEDVKLSAERERERERKTLVPGVRECEQAAKRNSRRSHKERHVWPERISWAACSAYTQSSQPRIPSIHAKAERREQTGKKKPKKRPRFVWLSAFCSAETRRKGAISVALSLPPKKADTAAASEM